MVKQQLTEFSQTQAKTTPIKIQLEVKRIRDIPSEMRMKNQKKISTMPRVLNLTKECLIKTTVWTTLTLHRKRLS